MFRSWAPLSYRSGLRLCRAASQLSRKEMEQHLPNSPLSHFEFMSNLVLGSGLNSRLGPAALARAREEERDEVRAEGAKGPTLHTDATVSPTDATIVPPTTTTTLPPNTTSSPTTVPSWARPSTPIKRKVSCATPPMDTQRQLRAYFELAKPRLTALVVLSTMSAYALAPNDLSLIELLYLTTGTALCSGSANAINMAREPEYDALMSRTKGRPVAAGRLSATQAMGFAGVTGVAGVGMLYLGVNPLVAGLGAANIALYGGLYTSLKRVSITNTWVGALVGAIPPLMGWAACSSLYDPVAWVLAGLLYSWQFPHFMSLSYVIGEEYKQAGYVMSAWTDPLLTARVALRHSLAMFPLCFGFAYFGATDIYFCLDSSIVNAWLTYTAFRFWLQQRELAALGPNARTHSGTHKKYARILFWASVIHLPVVLVLAMLHKKGRWDWLFARFGRVHKPVQTSTE